MWWWTLRGPPRRWGPCWTHCGRAGRSRWAVGSGAVRRSWLLGAGADAGDTAEGGKGGKQWGRAAVEREWSCALGQAIWRYRPVCVAWLLPKRLGRCRGMPQMIQSRRCFCSVFEVTFYLIRAPALAPRKHVVAHGAHYDKSIQVHLPCRYMSHPPYHGTPILLALTRGRSLRCSAAPATRTPPLARAWAPWRTTSRITSSSQTTPHGKGNGWVAAGSNSVLMY